MLQVNYSNLYSSLAAVGVDAVEDGLDARRGPGLVIYEAEAPCPEIPTSQHTALTPTTSTV